MQGRLYFVPRKASALSSIEKLKRAAKTEKPSVVRTRLQKQDTFTLQRPVRKRSPRNAYSVTNILDIFECDLVDVQALSKHNDGHKYLLTVIDVFSKFLHIVPLKSKTGKDVSSAFQSVLKDPNYLKPLQRRPV